MKKIHGYAFAGCDSLSELLFDPGVDISPLAFETKEPNRKEKH